MNPYLKNLNKIEFVVTYACTGKCKHCSEGDHAACGEHIDASLAAKAVEQITAAYPIETVMTFGGEPLLYPEAVYAIHSAARTCGVARRQLITNGYFTKDPARIRQVAERLAASGVNDLLLSVDAFHQETIPLEVVWQFAKAAKDCGIPIRLQPAWLVSPEDPNPYNQKTHQLLHAFDEMEITVGQGNMIFPEGNAKRYLSEYFTQSIPQNPYVENKRDLRCLSFDPDGGVLDQNFYHTDILTILKEYNA